MSIIIRLQNLPLTANAEDIRRFFDNLIIPDGGVHIIGGEHGDAFIVFGSDEDARLAMQKDGGSIKNTKVKLLLSSRVEMQKIIDTAKQQALSSHNLMQTLAAASQYDPAALQMHMLPNMLSMLPGLRNLPGMPPIAGIPPVPIAGLPNLTMPTAPQLAAQKAVDPKPASTTPVIQTQTGQPGMAKDKSKRDTTKGSSPSESKSRSRSRSRSRERRTTRDRYKRDRSRDRKHRRDRSRSKERDKSGKSRSRSRDRYRKRSRSKDRKPRGDPARERDNRDPNYRDKDRRREKGDESKSKSPPNGRDPAAAKKFDQDSRISNAPQINPIAEYEAADLKLPFNQNNGIDKAPVNQKDQPVLPPVAAPGAHPGAQMASWWSNMIRPPMMPSWIPPNTHAGDPAKLAPDGNHPKNNITPGPPFGTFPFGQGFPPHNPAAMFPYGGMFTNSAMPPAMHMPPNMMLNRQNPALQGASNGADMKADPRIARKPIANHRDNEEEECDRFGRQRKPRLHDEEGNDDNNYDDRHVVRRPRYETGYETRKYGGRPPYDENSRESYGNEDNSYPRKNPYKRTYGYQDDFDPYNADQDSSNLSEPRSSYNSTQRTENCVEIKNVPATTTESDIKKFFSPIPVFESCIKFIGNKETRNRNVLVKFINPAQKEQALQKNGFTINGSHVYIVPASLSAWESAEKNAANVAAVSEPYLKVDFIPKRARPHDITGAFTSAAPLDIAVSKVKNRESLVAYLKFPNVEDVKTTLEEKHKILICESRVKVAAITESEFEEGKRTVIDPYVPDRKADALPVVAANADYSPPRRYRSDRYHYHRLDRKEVRDTVESQPHIKSTCVILKNLPSEVNDKELVDFFADVNIIPAQIHIMFNADYKQSGESYCEFRTETDAETALKKNHQVLRDRTISVSLVPKETVTQAIGIPTLTPLVPYDAAKTESKTTESQSQKDSSKKSSNDSAEEEQIDDLKSASGNDDYEYNSNGRDQSVNHKCSRPVFNGVPVPPAVLRQKADWFGKAGCVVAVTNVPYRADVGDILDFFSDFGVTKEQVIRRFNEKGQATGDARVCFETPFEAQRAARMLDGQQMLERYITVHHMP